MPQKDEVVRALKVALYVCAIAVGAMVIWIEAQSGSIEPAALADAIEAIASGLEGLTEVIEGS